MDKKAMKQEAKQETKIFKKLLTTTPRPPQKSG